MEPEITDLSFYCAETGKAIIEGLAGIHPALLPQEGDTVLLTARFLKDDAEQEYQAEEQEQAGYETPYFTYNPEPSFVYDPQPYFIDTESNYSYDPDEAAEVESELRLPFYGKVEAIEKKYHLEELGRKKNSFVWSLWVSVFVRREHHPLYH